MVDIMPFYVTLVSASQRLKTTQFAWEKKGRQRTKRVNLRRGDTEDGRDQTMKVKA